MPVISTNDYDLHVKLKKYVADHPGLTIGRAVEDFTRFCLALDISELSPRERERIEGMVKQIRGN